MILVFCIPSAFAVTTVTAIDRYILRSFFDIVLVIILAIFTNFFLLFVHSYIIQRVSRFVNAKRVISVNINV